MSVFFYLPSMSHASTTEHPGGGDGGIWDMWGTHGRHVIIGAVAVGVGYATDQINDATTALKVFGVVAGADFVVHHFVNGEPLR